MAENADLLAELESEDITLRRKAVFSVGEKKIKDAIPKLIDLVEKDPDNVVRNSAARAFGKIGVKSDEVFQTLEKSLSDSDIHVRANSCWSLGSLRDPRAIPILEKMVDPSQRTYTMSADNSKHTTGSEANEQMREEGMKSSDVIIAAVKALGSIRDPKGVPALEKALEDLEDGAVRCAAALALGRIKDKSAVPALIKALSDKYWYVQRDAAIALGKINDPSAAPTLALKTNDMYDEVREHSLAALFNLGKTAGPTIFKLYLKNPRNEKLQQFIKKNFTKADLKSILQKLIESESNPQKREAFEKYLAKME